MVTLRHSLLLSTLLVGALSSPSPARLDAAQQDLQQPQPCTHTADRSAFARLLASVDESSLHSALHDWSTRFKDGVYSRDRSALEAVHSENAPVATALLNLAKRADTNTNLTTSTSPPTPSSSRAPTPTPSSSRAPLASSQSSTPPSSVAPPPPVTVISTSTLPAPPPSSTSRAAPSTAAPSSTAEETTAAAASTTTDAPTITSAGSTFIPTSSTIISTFTLPDGGISTFTSVTVVDSPVTGGGIGAPDAGATGGSGGGPSLQNGAASTMRGPGREIIAVVAAAVMWAMVI